jgi:hypothetical protein
MRSLQILTISFSILVSGLCFAEQEHLSTDHVKPIKEIKVEELDFDQLSQESKIGSLADYVKDNETSLDSFLDAIKIHETQLILHPYAEGLAYVNGVLCHVGNYPQSIIYTVLEGPQYGLQTTTAYNGIVLYINYDYQIEYTPYGVILHHYYSDSKVVTGSNQVIIFY